MDEKIEGTNDEERFGHSGKLLRSSYRWRVINHLIGRNFLAMLQSSPAIDIVAADIHFFRLLIVISIFMLVIAPKITLFFHFTKTFADKVP